MRALLLSIEPPKTGIKEKKKNIGGERKVFRVLGGGEVCSNLESDLDLDHPHLTLIMMEELGHVKATIESTSHIRLKCGDGMYTSWDH